MKPTCLVFLLCVFFFYRHKATTRGEDFHCHQRCLLVGTWLAADTALIPGEWIGGLFSDNIAVTHLSELFHSSLDRTVFVSIGWIAQ